MTSEWATSAIESDATTANRLALTAFNEERPLDALNRARSGFRTEHI